MKGGPTDPPNKTRIGHSQTSTSASMKGGPTDPPNQWGGRDFLLATRSASMKGGPTDPPNQEAGQAA